MSEVTVLDLLFNLRPGSRNTVLGDGGLGTALQAAGLPRGRMPETWNLTHPREVARVHAAYAAAGARWSGTNTFGATASRLASAGVAGRVEEVNLSAVNCAREGAPDLPVLGSLGPSAAGSSGWEREYAEQAGALAEAGVDGFLAETIVRLEEGVRAVRAAAAAGVGPVLASFTPGEDGCLLDGTTPEAAAEALIRAGAAAVGVNCGAGPESLLPVAWRLVRAGMAPVLAAPNAGLPEWNGERPVYRLRPDAFAEAAIQFAEAGVRLFAGCCGVGPEHLRAAAAALRAHQGE